jgi:hypothetical protein
MRSCTCGCVWCNGQGPTKVEATTVVRANIGTVKSKKRHCLSSFKIADKIGDTCTVPS